MYQTGSVLKGWAMSRSSRVLTVAAIVAALGLVALGVAYGRRGEGPAAARSPVALGLGSEGDGYPFPRETAEPVVRIPTLRGYPEPTVTVPFASPTLPPEFLTVEAPFFTLVASWTVTPTPTPAPPTATPTRLPTLPPDTRVVLYPTYADYSVQIVRVVVDAWGNPIGPAYPAGPARGQRYQLSGLYPRPDGRHVAVGWQYGEGGGIGLLDVRDGQFTEQIGPWGYFLAWSPDGSKMLSHSGSGGPPYRLYLVDAETWEHKEIPVPHLPDGYRGPVTAATFSPDGRTVVVVHSGGHGRETEMWRLALYDEAEPDLLYRTGEAQISHVGYSPDGEEIAFVTGEPRAGDTLFREGDIWVMGADGRDARRVTRTVMLYYYDAAPLAPIWLGDGDSILFVRAQEGGLADTWDGLRTNLCRVEVASGRVEPVTEASGAAVLLGAPDPGGAELLALVRSSSAGVGGFRPWVVNPQTGEAVSVEGWEVDNGRSFYGPVMASMTVAE